MIYWRFHICTAYCHHDDEDVGQGTFDYDVFESLEPEAIILHFQKIFHLLFCFLKLKVILKHDIVKNKRQSMSGFKHLTYHTQKLSRRLKDASGMNWHETDLTMKVKTWWCLTWMIPMILYIFFETWLFLAPFFLFLFCWRNTQRYHKAYVRKFNECEFCYDGSRRKREKKILLSLTFTDTIHKVLKLDAHRWVWLFIWSQKTFKSINNTKLCDIDTENITNNKLQDKQLLTLRQRATRMTREQKHYREAFYCYFLKPFTNQNISWRVNGCELKNLPLLFLIDDDKENVEKLLLSFYNDINYHQLYYMLLLGSAV